MSEKLVLIDGHSILNRAFYGVPLLTNAEGLHTNAVYGFLNIMFKILEDEKPDYLAVAFDVHAPTFRHETYAEYKGTRKGMPDELREQVPVIKEVLKAMDIVVLERPGFEADDVLGTLAKKAQKDGKEVSLVSGDRDLLQISDEHIKIMIPKTKQGKTEIESYYPADVQKTYQVTPLQFIELKALMGDTADNIPGVPKVGEKTATELMVTYGSLEAIYEHVEEISKKSIRESLKENKELADLSLFLATIKIDCDVELDYKEAKTEGFYTPAAYDLFKKLEFKNLLSRFSDTPQDNSNETIFSSFKLIDDLNEMIKVIDKARGNKKASIALINDNGTLKALSLTISKDETFVYFVKAKEGDVQLSLFDTFEEDSVSELTDAIYNLSSETKLYLADIKEAYDYLDLTDTANYFDVNIAAYLLNPLKNDYDIEAIANEHLGLLIPGTKELLGKLKPVEIITADSTKAVQFLGLNSYVCFLAGEILSDRLKSMGMYELFTDMEMPLSLVLYDMEKEGVTVKRDELKSYGDALTGRIEELEKLIHTAAGVEFNINSPKQLGEVLFETMNIPGGKKTKTGYSTAADVLEKLAGDYPIVKDILEYRGLAKLKSTYADGLANYIEADGRIHTNFNQTITATGRISSTEPNLQNIPMRMELGRKIRKVFVPREGCILMDADYSQIELRVLAHLSGDEQLIDSYRNNSDIHRLTASKVFHVPFDEVTDLQRRNAKAVNFGIVYGISSFGLSQDLSISRKEANEYIEEYFKTYPGLKHYLDELIENAKRDGYVTTLYGRRRPIPELSSSNFMQRSFGERVAMNSPIQGTAADIMKIAMINVWKEIRERGLKSRLILQVHDELVIETYLDEEDVVRELLSRNMTEAAELKVTLAIDLHTGNDWYEAK